jgi:hypothetical protein
VKFTPKSTKKIAFHYKGLKVPPVKPEKNVPLSLRLSPEMSARLANCAKLAKQKKHTLAQLAIEAAIEAIEESGGFLVVPIQFRVSKVPTEAEGNPYPRPKHETALVEDAPPEKLSSDPLAGILRITKKHVPKPGPGSAGGPPGEKK